MVHFILHVFKAYQTVFQGIPAAAYYGPNALARIFAPRVVEHRGDFLPGNL
jgi:hypothetical protein